jgi:hypothetical protein
MANRSTRFQLKHNSTNTGSTLPSSGILVGEPLVNLYDGILYFSGEPTGNYVTGNANTGYFEVGSRLTNLNVTSSAITNNLSITGTGYYSQTATGASLTELVNWSSLTAYSNSSDTYVTGGTINVLPTVSNITGTTKLLYNDTSLTGYTIPYTDVFVTGFTYSNNTFTIKDNSGNTFSDTFSSVTGLTVNGNLTVTGNTNTNNIYVTTSAITNNLSITGTGYYSQTATGASSNELVNYGTLTGFSQTNDVYVTGNTVASASTSSNTQTLTLSYHGTPIGGPYTLTTKDTFTSGGTYSAGTITFKRNDSSTYTVTGIDGTDTFVTGGTINVLPTVSNITGTTKLLYNDPTETSNNYTIPYTDVFVTGFTYSNNTFAIKDNSGNTFSDTFSTVTGLTVNGNLSVTGTTTTGTISATTYQTALGNNLVVYTNGSGNLTTEAGFGYDVPNNTLIAPNATIGSGGSIYSAGTGDLVVHGNLTVFGDSISAFTSNLYVEDNNIVLNFNPTGSTANSSVNSGFEIRDGSGISGDSVNFDIVRLQYLTGLTSTQITPTPYTTEYSGTTGYNQRGWITQLNDIVIRSTDITDNGTAASINGVRVLAEFDTLDGGSY